jgi:hypothetical protein
MGARKRNGQVDLYRWKPRHSFALIEIVSPRSKTTRFSNTRCRVQVLRLPFHAHYGDNNSCFFSGGPYPRSCPLTSPRTRLHVVIHLYTFLTLIPFQDRWLQSKHEQGLHKIEVDVWSHCKVETPGLMKLISSDVD